ncbi:uncharacterized protein AFUA_6G00196 [Aspergillus fumigatus Af293]|uniref:MFS transporter n=2 Tax=Aspergillus fumigatus TaxID=746128 RepID=Q4W8X3_ASPFU|nr:conserved hypothetical protein [Aspergillus fumigatus Af293]EAL84246.1 conserved hypothetical protein [Aspergillus fumigatus Af293]EDP47879.1 conserved hypothetical protein [Aspergillus fumigatus A1163]
MLGLAVCPFLPSFQLKRLCCCLFHQTIVPTAPQILQDFHSRDRIHQTLLVTIWELGEGIGPFFIAPLSERFGRLPVLHLGKGGGWTFY